MAAPARTRTGTRTAEEIEAARVARAVKVEALNEQLAQAVERLATSEGWAAMLTVAARLRRYSINNQILLWAQAEERGVTLTRVASFGVWKSLGYRVRKGSTGFGVFAPRPQPAARRGDRRVAEQRPRPVRRRGATEDGRSRFQGRLRLRPGAGRARAGTCGAGAGA
jgi:antirestriction protein ArdC